MFGVVFGEGMGARTKPRRKLALIPNMMYERREEEPKPIHTKRRPKKQARTRPRMARSC